MLPVLVLSNCSSPALQPCTVSVYYLQHKALSITVACSIPRGAFMTAPLFFFFFFFFLFHPRTAVPQPHPTLPHPLHGWHHSLTGCFCSSTAPPTTLSP